LRSLTSKNIVRPEVVFMDRIKRSLVIQLLFSFVLYSSILIFSFQGFPKGSDTPAYYLHLRMLKEQGYSYLLYSGFDRPLTNVFLAILDFLLLPLNLTPPYFLLYAQLILGMTYISSIFFIVYVTTKNQEAAFLSSALAATSALTLKFQPNISNLLGLSLATFSLGFFMKYQAEPRRNFFLMFLLFFFLSYLSYPYITLIFMGTIILSLVMDVGYSLITNYSVEKERVIRNLRLLASVFGLVTILFVIWYLLWGIEFLQVVRIWQVQGWSMPVSFSLSFLEDWISLETWILKITGILGLFFVHKFVKSRSIAPTFYTWLAMPILANLLCFVSDLTNRFFQYITFAVPSAFLVISVYKFVRTRESQIFGHRVKTANKFIAPMFVILLLAGNYYEASCWQQSNMGPWITNQNYEVLLNAKEHIKDNSVVLVYPVRDRGRWAEAMLASIERNIQIYYGEIGSLVRSDVPLTTSDLYLLKLPEENYTIVLLEGFYPITGTIKEVFSKVDEDFFYLNVDSSLRTALLKLEDYKIAIMGFQADPVIKVIRELGFSYDYLGDARAHLPDTDKLSQYDLLILPRWWASSSEDTSKLAVFNQKKPIIALSDTGYHMSKYNKTFFREAFGGSCLDAFKSQYGHIVYFDNTTSFTSHLMASYASELSGACPIGNLTTSKGLARIVSNEELYALVTNENKHIRNAYYGIMIADMDRSEILLFKRLILWSLGLL